MRLAEQAVEEPHLALVSVTHRNPVDVAFDLVGIRTGRARFAVGQVVAMHGDDSARCVLVEAGAIDHEAVTQPNLVSWAEIPVWCYAGGIQAEIALGRCLHEILALDPQLARSRC